MNNASLTIGVAWNGSGELQPLLDRAQPIGWVDEVLVAPSNAMALQKAKGLMENYSKLRCLEAGDQGIYSAYNKLIFGCRTSHLCFHGADDFIIADPCIADAIRAARSEEILVFNLRYCTTDGKYLQSAHHQEHQPPAVALGRYTSPATPEVVYPVAVMRTVGGADESFRIAGDADLFFRVRANVTRVDIHLDFAEMRDGGASTAAKYSWTVYRENRRIALRHGHHLTDLQITTAFLALAPRAALFKIFGERFSNKVTDFIRRLAGKPPRFTSR